MIHEVVLSLLLLDDFPRRRIVRILESIISRPEGRADPRLFPCDAPDLAGVSRIAAGTLEEARRLIRRLDGQGIHITCMADSAYPVLLREIHNPPPVLFYKGGLPHAPSGSVAIVGSRKASLGGLRFASRLAYELAESGIVVVSGLARGIDTASHRGALDAGGETVAVLGCGIDMVYPPENTALAAAIARSGGVVTELLPDVQPLRANFPQRNRIISGLSLGTVVVEAGDRSGALITASCALEQNRSVLAVPGTPGYYGSKGTNSLLKQGATLVESVEDILEEVAPQLDRGMRSGPGVDLPGAPGLREGSILDLLSADPVHVDEICRHLDLESRDVMNLLFSLETRGLVRSMPGKFYVRGSVL